jgi:hypothetical protein
VALAPGPSQGGRENARARGRRRFRLALWRFSLKRHGASNCAGAARVTVAAGRVTVAAGRRWAPAGLTFSSTAEPQRPRGDRAPRVWLELSVPAGALPVSALFALRPKVCDRKSTGRGHGAVAAPGVEYACASPPPTPSGGAPPHRSAPRRPLRAPRRPLRSAPPGERPRAGAAQESSCAPRPRASLLPPLHAGASPRPLSRRGGTRLDETRTRGGTRLVLPPLHAGASHAVR